MDYLIAHALSPIVKDHAALVVMHYFFLILSVLKNRNNILMHRTRGNLLNKNSESTPLKIWDNTKIRIKVDELLRK